MVIIHLNNDILERVNSYQAQDKVVLSINNTKILINKSFFVAISPKFCSKYRLDNSISTHNMEIVIKSNNTYKVLQEYFQYSKSQIECDDTVMKDLFQIGLSLEIKELINVYKTQIVDKKIIDTSNCIQLLEDYFYTNSHEKIIECIDFISLHFYEVNSNQLILIAKKLGLDIFEKILTNSKLAIKDEDSLAKFIISLAKESDNFVPLIEHIHFDSCNDEIIDEIQDLINENNYKIFIQYFGSSFLKSRHSNNKNRRFFVLKEFHTKVAEFKNSNDIESLYQMFDTLSEDADQKLILRASEDREFCVNILHLASKKGNLSLIQSLIECDFDKETENKEGYTPLMIASSNGQLNIVKYLISIGCDRDKISQDGCTPFALAAMEGHFNVVEYLNSIGANIEAMDRNGWTALMFASSRGHLDIVKYLICLGAKKEAANTNGFTPLMLASSNGHLEVVKYLISIGANKDRVNIYGITALYEATCENHLEVVKYLISVEANSLTKNIKGDSLILGASREGNLEIIKYLISIGSSTEEQNEEGFTPLLYASYNGHIDVVKYLISIGCNLNAMTNEGYTAFTLASIAGFSDVARYLFSIMPQKI